MAERLDVLVIGSGFGGAATAWWLRRRGVTSLKLLERDETPGSRASGKNAGIVRQALADGCTATMASLGGAFLRDPPEGFSDVPFYARNGGFILATRPDDQGLETIRKSGHAAGVAVSRALRAEVFAALPILDGAPFQSALHSPTDGVVDIHEIHQAYLRGTQVTCGCAVTGFSTSDRKIREVRTDHGEFRPDLVVLAAGAWSAQLGALAGGVPFPLTPKRRHLVHTGPLPWAGPSMPYAWHQTPEVYFRPESGGLLLSPCDEDPMPPCSPKTDPEAPAWLHARLKAAFPRLVRVPVARTWAELRCFVPDNRFVIGRDPRVANLLWVCALGGHGMTCSSPIGELASALATGAVPPVEPTPFDPRRFS